MMKTNTKKTFIFLTIIFIASVLILVFVNHSISKKVEAVTFYQENYGDIDSGRDTIFIERVLDDNKEKIEKIESIFIENEREIDFLEEIESVGRSVGVSVTIQAVGANAENKRMQIEKEDGGIDYEEYRSHGIIEISMRAEGNRANILNFLSRLENMQRKITIVDFRLSKGLEDNNMWVGSFKLTGLSN